MKDMSEKVGRKEGVKQAGDDDGVGGGVVGVDMFRKERGRQ